MKLSAPSADTAIGAGDAAPNAAGIVAPVPATKPAAAEPAPEPVEQIPHQGGSYVRLPDGSLDRVEFTAHPDDAEEAR